MLVFASVSQIYVPTSLHTCDPSLSFTTFNVRTGAPNILSINGVEDPLQARGGQDFQTLKLNKKPLEAEPILSSLPAWEVDKCPSVTKAEGCPSPLHEAVPQGVRPFGPPVPRDC